MKRSFIKTMICLIMALVTAVGSPLMSIATEQDGMYLSDLKIGYGDEGKASLEAKGYKVYNQNVNETGQGQSVYIGYKTTNVAEEAITDIATMNMNGRYSFDKYAEYLNEVYDTAETAASQFMTAVNEFADLFKGKSDDEIPERAKMALTFLNKFYDDDYKDPEGKVSNKIGDMIVGGKLTGSVLTRIFYEGNLENITAIKRFISIGITETGDDTFLTRLKNFEYTDKLSNLTTARSNLLDDYEEIRDYMNRAKDYADAAAQFGGTKKYLASIKDTTDKMTAAVYIGTYEAAVAVQYGSNLTMPDGNAMTLFDALTLPTQDEYDAMEEEPECEYTMDAYMIDILARSMTAGQLSCLAEFSVTVMINNTTYSDTDASATMENLISSASECSDISVYAGVDRSLFEDADDVALTAACLEEMNKGGTNNIGRCSQDYWATNKELKVAMVTIGAIAAAVAVALTITCFVRKAYSLAAFADLPTNIVAITTFEGGAHYAASSAYISVTQSCFIAGAIAWVVVVACLIVLLVKYFEKPADPTKIEYTKIPRALVHMVEDGAEKNYYNYYAVKLINASDDTDDYMNVYGDLNGNCGYCQWQCLYVTTDSRCGNPLSSDIVFKLGTPDNSLNETNGYLAVHDFDSEVATSFNAYTGSDNPTAIYAYVKRAVTSSGSQAATIFEENPITMCIAALILGAGLSCGATLLITRKRRVAG